MKAVHEERCGGDPLVGIEKTKKAIETRKSGTPFREPDSVGTRSSEDDEGKGVNLGAEVKRD